MPTDNNIVIKVESLSKAYKLYDNPVDRLKESIHPFRKKYHRDFFALENVSLEVRRGETIGIIGKNGSGKSTLLKIISGVLTPSEGSLQINGKVSALLELGAGFNPELPGLENVYLNGTLHGYTKEYTGSRLDDILDFADIGDFVHQPIKTYSNGMLVRLAFAAAINIEPDILIVDEALAVGDIRFQRKCFAKFEEFRKAGKTILFVSHAIDTINLLCDRAILINDGQILHQGEPKYVTRIYQEMMLGVDITKKTGRLIDKEHQLNSPSDSDAVHNKEVESYRANIVPGQDRERIKQIASDKLMSVTAKKAEIIDYAILDEFGKRVTLLESGKKYTLMSRILIYQDLDHILIGYPIKNKKGLLLFAVNNKVQHITIQPQQRGNILEGRVDVTMWLAPGDYFASFIMGNLEELYDEVHDAIHFVVIGDCNQTPYVSIVNLKPQLSVINMH